MNNFRGKTLSWHVADGVIELVLDRPPCNEIGLETLVELEQFVASLEPLAREAHALIISSDRKECFSAGAEAFLTVARDNERMSLAREGFERGDELLELDQRFQANFIARRAVEHQLDDAVRNVP